MGVTLNQACCLPKDGPGGSPWELRRLQIALSQNAQAKGCGLGLTFWALTKARAARVGVEGGVPATPPGARLKFNCNYR